MLDRVVRDAARRYGDLAALAMGDETMSYAELDAASDSTAAGLAELGIGSGDVVALQLPTGFDYVVAYVGAVKAGAICAGVNPKLTAVEQQALVESVAPKLVINGPLPEGDPAAAPVVDRERPVAIIFTSGTTGTPKGALFGTRQLRAVTDIDIGIASDGSAPEVAVPDGSSPGGPMLAATQLPHVGFMTKLPWYLATGSTIWMLERWRADDVLRLAARTGMSALGGVAPQIALLVRSPLVDDLDLSRVRQFVVGGAMSSPALVRGARERFGAGYSIRYSSTESGGVGLATAPDADDDEVLHSIGRPRPGVEALIVDEDGAAVPDGEVGELVTRSAAQMERYWDDPAATADAVRDGWLHSGDLGLREASGLFRLVGRRKELYIRGGYNVAPAEVEAVLADHPGLADVAVVPRADEVMGEIGVAVVVPVGGAAVPTLDELRAFGAERLARWKLPEAIQVVDELPLTTMGKLDRAALHTMLSTP